MQRGKGSAAKAQPNPAVSTRSPQLRSFLEATIDRRRITTCTALCAPRRSSLLCPGRCAGAAAAAAPLVGPSSRLVHGCSQAELHRKRACRRRAHRSALRNAALPVQGRRLPRGSACRSGPALLAAWGCDRCAIHTCIPAPALPQNERRQRVGAELSRSRGGAERCREQRSHARRAKLRRTGIGSLSPSPLLLCICVRSPSADRHVGASSADAIRRRTRSHADGDATDEECCRSRRCSRALRNCGRSRSRSGTRGFLLDDDAVAIRHSSHAFLASPEADC